jgi:hypothetical protein
MKILSKLSPSCREVVRLQSGALDHKLPWLQRIGLRIHLALCVWCRRYGQQIRLLHSASGHRAEAPFDVPAGEMPAAARQRIKRALESAEK